MQRQSLRALLSLAQAAEQFKAARPLQQAALISLRADAATSPSSVLFSQLQCRGMAQQARLPGVPPGAYTPPPAVGRPSNLRISLVSSNMLAEPYKGEPLPLPLSSWVTPSGWKERFKRWMGGAKSMYTIAKVKKHTGGWSLPAFKTEALATYRDVCAALASGDKTALRHLVTPAVFTDMKRQIKTREDGGWRRVEWKMTRVPELKQLEVVQGRLIALDPKDDSTGFAQMTVKVRSGQTFAAYDSKGRLVAGNIDDEMQVEDHWVFEKPLKQLKNMRWRVAGRLTIPSAAARKLAE